jgi:hypothetical protein
MGFLGRLFARSDAPSRSSAATLFPGGETLEVVGEAYYQDALWRIVGGHTVHLVRHEIVASLLPEPRNPYDPNAVKIVINGLLVGHLSREDALAALNAYRWNARLELEPQIVRIGSLVATL